MKLESGGCKSNDIKSVFAKEGHAGIEKNESTIRTNISGYEQLAGRKRGGDDDTPRNAETYQDKNSNQTLDREKGVY